MIKRALCLFATLFIFAWCNASAAGYTLPEKMQNQLSIGSGLKGTFTVTAEGELSRTPFLNAITDASLDLRGMKSGNDLHYYLFQENNGEQINLAEVYRKDGTYYFRSDMVQDQILSFTGLDVYLDSLLQARGENPTLSSAVLKYLAQPEENREKEWNPIFEKYQNELEMWLHDFTVQAEAVKQEDGSTAFDFSYAIPVDEMKSKLVALTHEFIADAELQKLLDSILTQEQKDVYLNSELDWYYDEAIRSLRIGEDILMQKRVSALGELIDSRLVLPLDETLTGFSQLEVKSNNESTLYQLTGKERLLALRLPAVDLLSAQSYETSAWIASIRSDTPKTKENPNFAVRVELQKQFSQYNDEEERSHQTEHYHAIVTQDFQLLPEAFQGAEIPDWKDMEIDLDLHYHSKYSQNSATTLEVKLDYKQNGSAVTLNGKIKTAAPWLFMPFEINQVTAVGPKNMKTVQSYVTDWVSNAASMIHHTTEQAAPNADDDAASTDSSARTEEVESDQTGE